MLFLLVQFVTGLSFVWKSHQEMAALKHHGSPILVRFDEECRAAILNIKSGIKYLVRLLFL